ncbi:MAG TPA: hypothetical protein DCM87_09795 [Planctomycetes bacterium]|nr:hypothetical protein [Planctomycetota bacterium]
MRRKSLVNAAVVAAAAAAAWLSGCYSCDIKGRNESADALRSVAVDPSFTLPGEARGGQSAVVRQSYTIADGQFTFNRSVEKEVGTLGADFVPLSKGDAERLGAEPFSGVLIRGIRTPGPAEAAGLRADDVIVSYGGKDVMSVERLELLIEADAPGTRVDIVYQRGDTRVDVPVTLGAEKRVVEGKSLQQQLRMVDDRDRTGLKLAELTSEAHAAALGPDAPAGGLLVVEVLEGGPGFFADLRVRDHVVKVGGQPVAGAAEYGNAVDAAQPDGETVLTVRRAGRELELPIEVVEDARGRSDFNVFDIIRYRGEPAGWHFCLLYHLLFNSDRMHKVVRDDGTTRNERSTHWGAVLDLLHWKSTEGGRKELRLGWFFPISWGG